MTIPERPRLAPEVLARLHLADGEAKVILHDPRRDVVLEIEPASWMVLRQADGTRDLDALCLAAARSGLYRGEADLRALLEGLAEAGVLVDGIPQPAPPAPVDAPARDERRPLEPLPGYRFACDGNGSCCRTYGSVTFTRLEALRARVTAERMTLPLPADEAFTPLSGGDPESWALAVAQVEGRCLFLEGDGLCGLHRRDGALAKPFPCRFYPAMLVDDGVAVRVSALPECSCVYASAERPSDDAAPLVDPGARTLAELGPQATVVHVPDPVPLSPMRAGSVAALRAFSAALVDALDGTQDAAAVAWGLAAHIEARGLEGATVEAAVAPARDEALPWLSALGARARDVAGVEATWRGGSDRSRAVAAWIAEALADPPWPLEATDPTAEAFYLRSLAHGHRLAVEGRPLSHGLRDRATRILAARAMARRGAPVEPQDARWPLAPLEAAMRNLRLSPYADSVA